MKIIFKDCDDDIWFEFCDAPPPNNLKLGKNGYINLTGLYLYGMYRNSIYDSYKLKNDLALDIKEFKNLYQENEKSKYINNNYYNDPLYHYSCAASISAVHDWISQDKMNCYFAYKEIDKKKKIVGFVHFIEKTMNEKSVIYIAHAGVVAQGNRIGRRLMECVLAHYPENTHFTILTRIFNTEAKTLYNLRLKFSPLSEYEVEQLGYDKRYVGYERISTSKEIFEIKEKQILLQDNATIENTINAPNKLIPQNKN